MDFLLLGPVELRVAGRPLPLGGPRLRSLLAALAVDAGHAVPVPSLIDRVWGTAPPARAQHALHVYIGRLRRLIGDMASPARVVRRSGGYVLDVDPDRVDVHRFRRLVGESRDRECPDRQRVAVLGQALDLWRGAPLANLSDDWAAVVGHGWQQQRLDAALAWAQASLRLDEPDAAVARLTELVGEHPTVESLVAMLMRVLHAAGRPAEALDRYDRVRRLLTDQLGTDPGEELQRLYRQLLAADPAIETPVRAPVPRQLPAPPPGFTGRVRELAELNGVPDASTVVITAIDGMAGIGKTALAVHAAHQLAPHYPDGQLFVDLHGYTMGMAPVEPADALDRLLRGLGVSGEQVPPDLEARAALYRTRLADQKVLVLLDNAAAEDQVRPLLPGTAGCLVLVTSRRRLTGLDQTHGLSLDTLPLPDAVALFTRTVGEKRLADEPPAAVAETVELCGRLPLAIRIAAARLRSRPAWSLAHLVERLRDQQHRLPELEAGQRSVTAALDLSYRHLSTVQRPAYRLLGLHPGVEIDSYAAAALLDGTELDARQMLDQLMELQLLQEPSAARYRFHDLTRAHAVHTANEEEAEPARHTAENRLFDYYRYTASVAVNVAYPYDQDRWAPIPPSRGCGPDLRDVEPALEWLDVETPNLLATARYALDRGRLDYVHQLSAILHRHLRTRGRYGEAEVLHHQALTAARQAGDRDGELAGLTGLGLVYRVHGRGEQVADVLGQALRISRAAGNRVFELDALIGLGWACWRQGHHARAASHHTEAMRIARATGDRAAELDALYGLGHVHWMQGRFELAAEHHQRVLRIAQAIGNRLRKVDALIGLGDAFWPQGRHEQAADHYQQALQMAHTSGSSAGELNALIGLGQVNLLRGRYDQATDHYRRALRIARATGHRPGERAGLSGLGRVFQRQGRYEQAADEFGQLLDLARESGDRNWQFEAVQGIGRLRSAVGDPDAAIGYHIQALALAGELGQPVDEARAHDGLAHAYAALGAPGQGRHHWQHALDILTGLGVDRTDDEETTVPAIRAHLADLDQRLS